MGNNSRVPAVGIDMVSIARCKKILQGRTKHHLQKLFTPAEIAYGKRYKNAAQHFAGMFAAKEAASKALGTERYPYLALEVRHAASGAPEIWCRGKRVSVAVSITHEGALALAVALNYEKMPRTRSR